MEKERLEQLLNFYAKNPDDSFVLFGIAKEYEKLNKPEKAIDFLEKIKRKDPNYLGLYYHLAKLYEKVANFKAAIENYNQGISIAINKNAQRELRELKEALTMLTDEDI